MANSTIYKECVKDGKREDGVLICDEVEVACQLMWNSQSQKLMGFMAKYVMGIILYSTICYFTTWDLLQIDVYVF